VRAIPLSWNFEVSVNSPLEVILISPWLCDTDRLLSIASDQVRKECSPNMTQEILR
jgi:hypothetical protein